MKEFLRILCFPALFFLLAAMLFGHGKPRSSMGELAHETAQNLDFSRKEMVGDYAIKADDSERIVSFIGWTGSTDIYDSVKCGDGWLYVWPPDTVAFSAAGWSDSLVYETEPSFGDPVPCHDEFFRQTPPPLILRPFTGLRTADPIPDVYLTAPPYPDPVTSDTLRQYPVVDTVATDSLYIATEDYSLNTRHGSTSSDALFPSSALVRIRHELVSEGLWFDVWGTIHTTWHPKVQVWVRPCDPTNHEFKHPDKVICSSDIKCSDKMTCLDLKLTDFPIDLVCSRCGYIQTWGQRCKAEVVR